MSCTANYPVIRPSNERCYGLHTAAVGHTNEDACSHNTALAVIVTSDGQNLLTPGINCSQVLDSSVGCAPGPMRGQTFPVHQTVAPYAIPNCSRGFMINQLARHSVHNKAWSI